MVIFQIVTRRQRRGAEVFAALLAEELCKRGHQVYFISLYKTPANLLNINAARIIDLNGRASKIINLLVFFRLLLYTKKYRPDIIQANGSDTLKYTVALKIFHWRSKIVYRNISMVSKWIAQRKLIHLFNKILFNQVDAVASVSKNSLNDLVHLNLIPEKKGIVIHRGVLEPRIVSQHERDHLKDQLAIHEGAPVLLHVGRFSTEKNHPFLLEVVEKLRAEIPHLILLFAGEGEELERIQSMAASMGIHAHVRFVGSIADLQPYYQIADALVISSWIEGLPGVILEAGINEKPCIAVKVGGIPEVIINHETGILIPTHDAVLFSSETHSLLQNEKMLKQMGLCAKNLVTSRFSLPVSVSHFENLYFNLLKQSNSHV